MKIYAELIRNYKKLEIKSSNDNKLKTSFVIYRLYRILKDYPDKDINIIYFSLELGANTLLAKLLSLYIEDVYGIDLTYMQLLSFTDKLSDEQYKYVQQAKE